MDNLTCIYYTSNREDPEFEKRVQQTLLEAVGDLPIISVSQKPIDFGKNICVGDIGASAENILVQLREGVLAAETKYTVQAEDDCLYHKSYFDFRPERSDTIYQPDSFYLLWPARPSKYYWKKRGDLSGFSSKQYLLNILDKVMSEPFDHMENAVRKCARRERFQNEIPIVSFKTANGLHYGSPIVKRRAKRELPYWGKSRDLVKRYI